MEIGKNAKITKMWQNKNFKIIIKFKTNFKLQILV